MADDNRIKLVLDIAPFYRCVASTGCATFVFNAMLFCMIIERTNTIVVLLGKFDNDTVGNYSTNIECDYSTYGVRMS
jgi:hypothetical protein